MELRENLKSALDILEAHGQVVSQPQVKGSAQKLSIALKGFLDAVAPFQGIDWHSYLDLSNTLVNAKITKTNLPDLNRRIRDSGLQLKSGRKTDRQQLALEAARKGKATTIAEELKKPQNTVDQEYLYDMARQPDIPRFVGSLPEQKLKKSLKIAGLNERKKRKNGKQVFDRSGSEMALIEHLKELSFRIG